MNAVELIAAQARRQTARKKLVRKVRRIIGKGKTDMERGYYWMNTSMVDYEFRPELARVFGEATHIENVSRGVPGNMTHFERWIWTVEVDGFEFDIISEDDASYVRISYM